MSDDINSELIEEDIGVYGRPKTYDFEALPIGGIIERACAEGDRHRGLWNAARQFKYRNKATFNFEVKNLRNKDGSFWGIRVRRIHVSAMARKLKR